MRNVKLSAEGIGRVLMCINVPDMGDHWEGLKSMEMFQPIGAVFTQSDDDAGEFSGCHVLRWADLVPLPCFGNGGYIWVRGIRDVTSAGSGSIGDDVLCWVQIVIELDGGKGRR